MQSVITPDTTHPRGLSDQAIETAVQALLDGRRLIRRAGLVGWRAKDFDTATALLREKLERRWVCRKASYITE